jgi:ketosteroid isomerase-like protein
MKVPTSAVAGALLAGIAVTAAAPATAQGLTEAQARAIIAPWYALFNQPVQGDIAAIHQQVVTPDYQSCTGDGPADCWGRDSSIKVIGGLGKSIPDLKFDIKEVFAVGNRVIVRGEVTGTPAVDLFGGAIPHTGKSFRILAIDIQTITDGKISKTYHLENWFAAAGQLRAK